MIVTIKNGPDNFTVSTLGVKVDFGSSSIDDHVLSPEDFMDGVNKILKAKKDMTSEKKISIFSDHPRTRDASIIFISRLDEEEMKKLSDTFTKEAHVNKITDTHHFRFICWLYGHNRDLYNKHWGESMKQAMDEHEMKHPSRISNMTEEQKEKRRAECRRYRERKRQKRQGSDFGKSKTGGEAGEEAEGEAGGDDDSDDDESYTIT